MAEYKSWREVIVRAVLLIVLSVAAITMIMCLATSCVGKKAKLCEAKGGVYHWSRDGSLCLKKDAVL